MVKYQYFCDSCGEEIVREIIRISSDRMFEMGMEGYYFGPEEKKEFGHICSNCIYKALKEKFE